MSVSRKAAPHQSCWLLKFQLLAFVYHLIPNPAKWSNTLKQFVVQQPTNCLSAFAHFVGLAVKGLNEYLKIN